MFSIEEFMQGLDAIYQQGRIDQVEEYLLDGLRQTQDKEPTLVMLNDLMGYYRAVSRHEDMARCAHRVLDLIAQTQQLESVNHGTTLLNIATGYRAAGRYEEAEAYYKHAQQIFDAAFSGPDYRLATLHNNLGLLYVQTGRLKEAKEQISAALALTRQMPEMETELAITYTNLGNVCFSLHETSEGTDYMKQAVALFEKTPGSKDPHYPAALAGLGEAAFHAGRLEESAGWYQRALDTVEQLYGKNDDWETTRQNLAMVQELIDRHDAMSRQKVKGLALSKAYFEAVGLPMLQEKYPNYISRIAAGLAGEGSECLGFDDTLSTDHDFGPGFCLWLTGEDYALIGERLQKDYDALAQSWQGFPVRNTTTEGTGRVGVLCMDDFFEHFTGMKEAVAVKSREDMAPWLKASSHGLLCAVNGAVFTDPLGEFSRRREGFRHYPQPVRLALLADGLHRMAQAGQYNYDRGQKRGDLGMMYASLTQFISAACETVYLLNDAYMPFYKWRSRGMKSLARLCGVQPLLDRLMAQCADSENTGKLIEQICLLVVKELHEQGLTHSEDSFLDVQQKEILNRMEEYFKEDAAPEKALPPISPTKDALVDQVVAAEWAQFQKVRNEGGRASCQNNFPTFKIMRKSQFYTWSEPVLEAYLEDLQEGEAIGWNLVMEKYARMMEHTSPEAYKAFADKIPALTPQRQELQEQLIAIVMGWTDELQSLYPFLSKTGRNPKSLQDSEWDTSSETYLRGEMSTYSDYTVKLYGQMILQALQQGRNLVEENLGYMVHFYGYTSLAAADKACQRDAGL